ncbi:hypothetical protein J2S36_000956 [Arcanobacterium hippocoleae]|uniref:Uncharacterized protein n=1 Tax=Arcanobacterium hippocoleae TaxID=149017 RepID=A0ABU1T207_9ACTO|nr:hypothetical protein [Arcanobacterium hippocoleae]
MSDLVPNLEALEAEVIESDRTDDLNSVLAAIGAAKTPEDAVSGVVAVVDGWVDGD